LKVTAIANESTDERTTEIQSYLSSPRVENTANFDVVLWWSRQQITYPILRKISKDYLSMMPTSVESERNFNIGGMTATSSRSSLNPETVRELMCLKSWNKVN